MLSICKAAAHKSPFNQLFTSLAALPFNLSCQLPSAPSGSFLLHATVDIALITGIKVDKGLVPLANSNGESWCQGLDGLAQRTAEYYKAGARFAKWRSVVSIPAGPSKAALVDCAYGLARYAAIAQVDFSLFESQIHVAETRMFSICCGHVRRQELKLRCILTSSCRRLNNTMKAISDHYADC